MITFQNPIYFDRNFYRDSSQLATAHLDKKTYHKILRITNIALPIITFCVPGSFFWASFGCGAMRLAGDIQNMKTIISKRHPNASITIVSQSEKKALKKTLISTSALVATCVAPPCGMIITNGYDLICDAEVYVKSKKKSSQELFLETTHLVHNALYLSSFVTKRRKVIAVTLGAQMLIHTYTAHAYFTHSKKSFSKEESELLSIGHVMVASLRSFQLYRLCK